MKHTISLLLLLASLTACGPTPDDALDSSTGAETDAPSTGDESTGDESSSTGEGAEESSTGEPADDSSTGSTGDTTSGGGWGGDSGEPAPSCFADPCDEGECGSGLVCMPHPTSGERMCVTPCGPAADACGEASAAVCDDPIPVACLAVGAIKGCFPV